MQTMGAFPQSVLSTRSDPLPLSEHYSGAWVEYNRQHEEVDDWRPGDSEIATKKLEQQSLL